MSTHHPLTGIVFIGILAVLAVTGMIVGAVLAANDYSSAGAFSIAAACVGVLGTLAGQRAGVHDSPSDDTTSE